MCSKKTFFYFISLRHKNNWRIPLYLPSYVNMVSLIGTGAEYRRKNAGSKKKFFLRYSAQEFFDQFVKNYEKARMTWKIKTFMVWKRLEINLPFRHLY